MTNKSAFTLIELLVVIMIIGILVTIATFGVREAQQSARDGKRKADLEQISAGLALYRSECNQYPGSISFGGDLTGGGSPPVCSGTYINNIPTDPRPGRDYFYSASGSTFSLCAKLEQDPNPPVDTSGCGGPTDCGTAGACNWKVSP